MTNERRKKIYIIITCCHIHLILFVCLFHFVVVCTDYDILTSHRFTRRFRFLLQRAAPGRSCRLHTFIRPVSAGCFAKLNACLSSLFFCLFFFFSDDLIYGRSCLFTISFLCFTRVEIECMFNYRKWHATQQQPRQRTARTNGLTILGVFVVLFLRTHAMAFG